MPDISTIIIAKNEADRITPTIASALSISTEVIVLDTGSTDETIAVARKAGARVKSVTWQGYGPTKNYGHTLAKADWILSLDADEVISDRLKISISDIALSRGEVYLMNRLVNYKNQDIYHSGWHPDWVYRLFHREDSHWNDASVHEKLVAMSPTKYIKLDGLLHHHSYRSAEHFEEKIDQYARLTAEGWKAIGKKPPLVKRVLGAHWKYFKSYYLQQGYKDGVVG
jgi:(heptosyl)LPS beta-1,4-glucosyltransferase